MKNKNFSINIDELLLDLNIYATLNNNDSYLINEFQKTDEDNYLFDINDYLSGNISFKLVENCIIASVFLKIKNETSYVHNKFSDGGVFIRFNVQKDSNFLAHHNYNSWWTMPIFCKNESEIPENTQVLSWQNNGDTYVLQTLCDDEFKSIIKSHDNSCAVSLRSNTSGYSEINSKVFVIAKHENPYQAFEDAMNFSLKELGAGVKKSSERTYPEMFNYLGFCTWNAFYSDVDEDGVLKKANEFCAKNLPVKWFLIDHGWSKSEHEKLTSFKEDFKKFPSGLSGLKEKLQSKNVDYLGVWQGFSGHWGTISENSEVHNEMKDVLLKTNTGDLIPHPNKAFTFWNTWHNYLKKQGVDFVKVDIQSSLAVFTEGLMSIGEASRNAHLALDASAGVNFNGAIINCMGMGMEQVLNRPTSGMSRNSNDFFPEKVNSFKKHVAENAYNTLYHSHVYHGDWDMWWTEHEDALNNSYLRALSGGPLYISDRPNETDASMLTPLILDNGFVLRCDNQGVIVKEQIFTNPSEDFKATKVCNIKGNTGYIGAFNCRFDDENVTASISASDIHQMSETAEYLVYDYTNKNAKIIKKDEVLQFNLEKNKSVFLSFTPINNDFAFLGSTQKFISSGVIKEQIGNTFVLNFGSEIMFYSKKSVDVKINGEKAEFSCVDNICTLKGTKENAVVTIAFKE